MPPKTPADLLKARQAAAQLAYDRMLAALIDYTPCGTLRVEDVQFIARFAQTLAFDATEQVAL